MSNKNKKFQSNDYICRWYYQPELIVKYPMDQLAFDLAILKTCPYEFDINYEDAINYVVNHIIYRESFEYPQRIYSKIMKEKIDTERMFLEFSIDNYIKQFEQDNSFDDLTD